MTLQQTGVKYFTVECHMNDYLKYWFYKCNSITIVPTVLYIYMVRLGKENLKPKSILSVKYCSVVKSELIHHTLLVPKAAP